MDERTAAPRREDPVYVLGVNSGPHDGSAALLRDGELVAMLEQERLSRNRYAFGESPADAIEACLGEAGIGLGEVSQIAVGWDVPQLVALESDQPFCEDDFVRWLLGANAEGCSRTPPLRYVSHHLAHAASAFHTSGFDVAAILVVDGRGEAVATTLAAGGPGGIDVLETWGTELSLGHLYGWASEWAGLTMWGTGKLMGLASYGVADGPTPLRTTADGYTIEGGPPADSPVRHHYLLMRSRLRHAFRGSYPFAEGDPADTMTYAGFAASVQRSLELVLLRLAEKARRETGHAALALAGGVALNCTVNGVIARSGIFDEIWIPPIPHDAGVSLGAAIVADRSVRADRQQLPVRLAHARWAPSTRDDADALQPLTGCTTERCDDERLSAVVAAHLASGRLVGWWQGRAEVGQRALGARSILGDPRTRAMHVRLNRAKGREVWRPLAPAVLAEHTAEFFAGALPLAAEFMLVAWPIRQQARTRLPAAVHVDGSARPQVVDRSHGRYRRVLEAFYELTGVPALLNTSFNVAGEPLVHSRADAVSTFLRSDLDVLVVDDLVVVKPESRRSSRLGAARVTVKNHPFVPWARS